MVEISCTSIYVFKNGISRPYLTPKNMKNNETRDCVLR